MATLKTAVQLLAPFPLLEEQISLTPLLGLCFKDSSPTQQLTFTLLTLDPSYELTGPITIGSTNLVSGGINGNSNATTSASPDRAGFAIGAQNTAPIFEFDVPGTFDLGTYAAPTNDFTNSITATVGGSAFTSGGSLAAETPITIDFVEW